MAFAAFSASLSVAALLALSPAVAAAQPDHPVRGPHAVAEAVSDTSNDDDGDVPPGAPKDDYGFVGWCYGALAEYLTIYDIVKPDLKDIDKMFGTSVQEDEPYTADVAAERVALKRFGAAIEATERSSPTPITDKGVYAIQSGRSMWAVAKLQTHRRLADAWLFWGIPRRCETASKALRARANPLPQTASVPSSIQVAMAQPAPTVDNRPSPPASALPIAVPAGPPPRAGAVVMEGH